MVAVALRLRGERRQLWSRRRRPAKMLGGEEAWARPLQWCAERRGGNAQAVILGRATVGSGVRDGAHRGGRSGVHDLVDRRGPSRLAVGERPVEQRGDLAGGLARPLGRGLRPGLAAGLAARVRVPSGAIHGAGARGRVQDGGRGESPLPGLLVGVGARLHGPGHERPVRPRRGGAVVGVVRSEARVAVRGGRRRRGVGHGVLGPPRGLCCVGIGDLGRVGGRARRGRWAGAGGLAARSGGGVSAPRLVGGGAGGGPLRLALARPVGVAGRVCRASSLFCPSS